MDLEPTGWSPAVDMFETVDEIILVADSRVLRHRFLIDLSVTGNILKLARGQEPRCSH